MKLLIADYGPMSSKMLETSPVKWHYETVSVSDCNEGWQTLQTDEAPQIPILD